MRVLPLWIYLTKGKFGGLLLGGGCLGLCAVARKVLRTPCWWNGEGKGDVQPPRTSPGGSLGCYLDRAQKPYFVASMRKPSNPPSSQLCIKNLPVGRSLLHPGLSPSDTLGEEAMALENLLGGGRVGGKPKQKIAAASAAVSTAALA